MLKQLTSAAIAVASIGFAPLTAEAYSVGGDCGNIMGYEACINYQDRNNADVIMWQGPNGLERIEASCYDNGTFDWTSNGNNTQMQVDMAVAEYCR